MSAEQVIQQPLYLPEPKPEYGQAGLAAYTISREPIKIRQHQAAQSGDAISSDGARNIMRAGWPKEAPYLEIWKTASDFSTLVAAMDSDPDPDWNRFHPDHFDPRFDQIRDFVRKTKLSPYYQDQQINRLSTYVNPDGSTSFYQLLDHFDIHIEEGEVGVYDKDVAKQLELRELVSLSPVAIHAMRKLGQSSLQARKGYATHVESFLWHYGEPFDTPDNLSSFFRDPYSEHRWRIAMAQVDLHKHLSTRPDEIEINESAVEIETPHLSLYDEVIIR